MTRATIAGGACVTALVLLVVGVAVRNPAQEHDVESAASMSPAITTEVHPGFLYGRVTVDDGTTYEGRLRWGRDQEAFWSDYFNGTKSENPWAAHAPDAPRNTERGLEIFGFKIGDEDRSSNLDRQFMARFGDVARIEAQFRHVLVTLKSGTVFDLDRFSAGDIDDGVRVWDGTRGIVDLDTRRIRTIEFLPTAPLVAAPERLHGTVRTRQGDFTGFIQWDRHDCVGTDELDGRTVDGERSLRYDTIRSIARQSRDSALVTLIDGREMVLSGTHEVGRDHRGIYIDDRRYGRVLISWDAFERVEFSPAGSGPAYGDFRPGRPLAGSVTTRDGRRIAGRLVYDFDESETTETLDTQSQGLDYYIPFDLITSIVPRDGEAPDAPRASVTLRDGEQLDLERTDDVGDRNAGMLIFVDGGERPEYVPWADVERVDLDHPPSGHR
jgi:hypothetical protein